jgi:hypothetical protein
MSFKFKKLVAAVALSAATFSANAAITAEGNSEFVFSAFNSVTGVGYTFDLNFDKFLDDFVGSDQATGSSGNTALLSGANVGSSLIGNNGVIFNGALTGLPFGSASNVQWNLAAFDDVGRRRLLTTIADPFSTTTNNKVASAVNGFAAYVSSNNSNIVTAADDTYAISAESEGLPYAGIMGNNFANNTAISTVGLGASANMYFLAQSTTNSSNSTSLSQQLLSFNGQSILASTYLDNGQWYLNVAAVPEADTSAMMLAGIGLMGFIAKRRRKITNI